MNGDTKKQEVIQQVTTSCFCTSGRYALKIDADFRMKAVKPVEQTPVMGHYLSHRIDNLWDRSIITTMAEGINVRFAGVLQNFIQQRVGEAGVYSSASEYIRALVRQDYEREEERKWSRLRSELQQGAVADESQFIALNAESILKKAKSNRKQRVS